MPDAVVKLRFFGLLLLLILLSYYFPWLRGDQAFYRDDLTYFFEPLAKFMSHSFAQGRLPLWNPWNACGEPQIAEMQPGIFYPFYLLFAALPFSQALAALLLFHQWIAGIGAYLLVECLGWGMLAAAVAGSVCALNGYMFSLEAIFPLIVTAAWVPLLFYLVRRAFSSGTFLPFVPLLSLVTALLVLAGRPEIYGPALVIAIAYPFGKSIVTILATHRSATSQVENGHGNLDPSPKGLESRKVQQGPQGPQGPEVSEGSEDLAGPQGSEDLEGSQGSQSSQGSQRSQGPQGPEASEDLAGSQRSQGPPGPDATGALQARVGGAANMPAGPKAAILPAFMVCLGIFAGVLLAMPQLLPALEWAQLSRRARGLPLWEVLYLSANWYDFVGLALPQPLGDFHSTANALSNLGEAHPGNAPFLPSAVVGPLTILLAVAGAADRGIKQRWLLIAALIGGILLAVGGYSPVMPFFVRAFPLLSFFRFPVKAMIFVIWSLAFLAALGTRSLLLRRPETRLIMIFSTVIALAFLAGALLVMVPQTNWLPVNDLAARGISAALLAQAQQLLGMQSLIAAVLLLLALAGLLLYWSAKIRLSILVALLLAEVVLPMMAGAVLYCRHFTDAQFFEGPSFAHDQLFSLERKDRKSHTLTPDEHDNAPADLKPGLLRIAQLYPDRLVPPAWYHAPDHSVVTYSDVSQYARQMLDLNTHMDFDVSSIFSYEGGLTGEYAGLADKVKLKSTLFAGNSGSDVPLARLCQMTAARYALSQKFVATNQLVRSLDPRFFHLVLENDALNLRIYQVIDPLPPAYVTGSWRWVGSSAEVVDAIVNSESSGFDAHRTVCLEGRSATPASSSTGIDMSAKVVLNRKLPEIQELDIRVERPGMLVTADQYYPGWHAALDGVDVPIYKANGFERAVFVPAGRHTVQYRYDPQSLSISFQLAAAGLGILIFGSLADIRANGKVLR